jgi:hypothetical protein
MELKLKLEEERELLHEWEFVDEECPCCLVELGETLRRKALASFPLHRRAASSQPYMSYLHGPVDRGGLC